MEEAEALTAEVQELMARHRIEQATFDQWAGSTRDRRTTRQIPIRVPCAAAKVLLLAGIASANIYVAIWD